MRGSKCVLNFAEMTPAGGSEVSFDMKLDRIKYEIVSDIVESLREIDGSRSVLDVGCRDTVLRRYLSKDILYSGVDLFQNQDGTVDHVQDFVDGLPIKSGSWDVVTALDVVEHVDDVEAAMRELWRVTGKHLIVILPNLAHASYRLSFLLKGHLGTDKYDMSYPPTLDRHRWLTTQQQADSFMETFAQSHDATLQVFHTTESPRKSWLRKIARVFGLGPNFWAWNILYVISRTE